MEAQFSASICVIGAGYVGLVTGACLAEMGHRVTFLDVDEERMAGLRRGLMPIHEPGLKRLMQRNYAKGTISFTTSYAGGIDGVDFIFLAVNTPSTQDGAADLSYIRDAARCIARTRKGGLPIVVTKSTVPVGANDLIHHILRNGNGASGVPPVVSNPEFLREGTAVSDFFHPDRVVIGSRNVQAAECVAELYAPLKCPILITDVRTAEMTKYASNAFLATKISFINELAAICESLGADVEQVATGMGLDKRIGSSFLRAGLGFGGSCLPNDVKALSYMAAMTGRNAQLLNAVMQVNSNQRRRLVRRLRDALGTLEGKAIAVLGLAFKSNTDDVRDSAALELIRLLRNEGAMVSAYDPMATDNARAEADDVTYCSDPHEAVIGAHAAVIATEWEEFRALDFKRVKDSMARPLIVDGRNLLDGEAMIEMGFSYIGVGKPESDGVAPAAETAYAFAA